MWIIANIYIIEQVTDDCKVAQGGKDKRLEYGFEYIGIIKEN